MAFWKTRHLPGLRITANGTQNDKAEAGSIPVLTTRGLTTTFLYKKDVVQSGGGIADAEQKRTISVMVKS